MPPSVQTTAMPIASIGSTTPRSRAERERSSSAVIPSTLGTMKAISSRMVRLSTSFACGMPVTESCAPGASRCGDREHLFAQAALDELAVARRRRA